MTNREAAIKIVKKLKSEGYQALFAGGCVRDMLLRKRPKDYDVVTDALPDKIVKIFKRTVGIGAKFGVIMVMIHNQKIEVATFRSEADYKDGRHPENVKFTTPKFDASRRDFTVNGMFYDPAQAKVIDYIGGQKDLQKQIIRTIGDPQDRFSEDYLRMLRAIRFSTRLQFKIAPKTLDAIIEHAPKILNISGERISAELEGILTNPNRTMGLSLLKKTDLLNIIFPGIKKNQADFAISVISSLPTRVDYPLALTALFADFPPKIAIKSLELLRLSRKQIKHIDFLLQHRGVLLEEDMSLSNLRLLLSKPYFKDLFALQKALQKARNLTMSPLKRITRRIKDLGDVDYSPTRLLNGYELIKLGVGTGPVLGQLAEEIYIAQLENEIKTKSQAVQWVNKWLEKHKKTK